MRALKKPTLTAAGYLAVEPALQEADDKLSDVLFYLED